MKESEVATTKRRRKRHSNEWRVLKQQGGEGERAGAGECTGARGMLTYVGVRGGQSQWDTAGGALSKRKKAKTGGTPRAAYKHFLSRAGHH